MKPYCLLPLFLVFFSCKNHEAQPAAVSIVTLDSLRAGFSNSADSLRGIKTDSLFIDTSGKTEKILAIRQRYQQINQTKGLTATFLDAEEFPEDAPDNGAEMTGYYIGDSLYKIKVGIGVSYCLHDYEYYYRNGQVVFIYETQSDFPIEGDTMNYNRTVVNYEGRYYLDNKKIIGLKTKGAGRLREETNAAYIATLLEDAKDYEKKLAAKRKKKGQ